MKPLRYRQVHLDFHTSENIPCVGDRFNKEQFQQALKAGNVDSITVFSKCHHGWSYHPSTANEMHPSLSFDLLGAELEACREIDVNAPVYISAGFDEKYARKHPDMLNKSSPDAQPADFESRARYRLLCYNTPYLDTLVAQIEEVMEKYNPSGIFLDISSPRICYCDYCLEGMRKAGLDCENEKDAVLYGEKVYAEYCRRTEQAVRKYNSETTIFHNAGNITRGRRDFAHCNTHLELESLPTGGWGYDHFPMSAAYARTLGMDFLGMTGKFHTTWGEFGGYKHPNALRYETALSVALGAKCSIGDQLHPSGEMNMSTYNLIGSAYCEIKAKTPYLENAKHISDIAILSAEAFTGKPDMNCPHDVGAVRMLLEGKLLFDVIDKYSELDGYKLLILPDEIRIDADLKEKLGRYEGKILLSGKSGLYADRDEFAVSAGVEYKGKNKFTPSYMIPCYDSVNGETAYVMYTELQSVNALGEIIAYAQEPYFNRTPEHFCSHQHTPNNADNKFAGAVLTDKTGYIAWNIFEDYAIKGSYHLKELVLEMIKRLLPEPTLTASLPDRGVASLTEQNGRYIAHLLFAHTTVRGRGTEVIEDIVPLHNITLSVRLKKAPTKVFTAEYENGEIKEKEAAFTYENGIATVNVDKINLHTMVIFK